MRYFWKIDVFGGIDINKTSASKEYDICHYWYFLNYSFRFQPNFCNRCHDFLMMPMNLRNIGMLNIEGFDYCCIISLISKNKAIKLKQTPNLTKKWNIIKHKNLLSRIKMCKEITFGNVEIEKSKFHRLNKTSAYVKSYEEKSVFFG